MNIYKKGNFNLFNTIFCDNFKELTNFNQLNYENTSTQAHKHTSTQVLRAIVCTVITFSSLFMASQNTQDYFLKINEGYDLGIVQKTVNTDQTLSLTMTNIDFSNFLNTKSIYKFDKAFPNLHSTFIDQVYLINMPFDTSINDIIQRKEVAYIELIDENIQLADEDAVIFGIIPNDYEDVITGGRNTALDLIKAPLAWTMSTGENVYVGISDSKMDLNHFDLQGQIVEELNIPPRNEKHGTAVAGIVSAKTDNGLGVASLPYNSKIVSAPNTGYNAVYALSQVPGVKVINCSWIGCGSSQTYEELYQAISDNGVLVVAAAGNGPGSNASCGNGHGYAYPASYDSTISVTSVGSRFPIGYFHDLHDPISGELYWWRSWKDCYEARPDYSQGGHTHNDKVDVTAPGQLVTKITDDYVTFPDGYGLSIGTSAATPFVSALAALIFSVNPNLTPVQVKNIIKNTADDIYHIPYNQSYVGQLGSGRINAYRAVKTAKCMLNPTQGLDLAMQNSDLDDFVEPDTNTEILWQSDDIWVRNENDGLLIDTHQNPLYNALSSNYVYVRVTNNSCVTSSGIDNLKLYWAKASTSLYWPDHWNGTLYMPDPTNPNPVLMGDEIGTLAIPVLGPGESKILEFPWAVPNPQDYMGINPNPWHFCLLARIESVDDPMTFPEGLIITNNVKNNNNIVWKNTTIVELTPNTPAEIGGVVAVGNPYASNHIFNLSFKKDGKEFGKPIYDEAEVSVEMDNVLYDAWVRGGNSSTSIDSTSIPNKKIVNTNNASLNNIMLYPEEIGTLNVRFNFLTNELTDKKNYTFYVVQQDAGTKEITGGETYKVSKKPRPVFNANAGNDETIDRSESVIISAAQINEAAVYNWYDPQGNLIYTGTDLTVSPDVTKTYKLEIITDIDGYKDYDEVEVTVNPYKLQSLIPNPATNQVTVNYIADEATSAYLMVVSTVTRISNNYILDVNATSINLDISAYTSGIYSVALVCDSEMVDSKNLAKQ